MSIHAVGNCLKTLEFILRVLHEAAEKWTLGLSVPSHPHHTVVACFINFRTSISPPLPQGESGGPATLPGVPYEFDYLLPSLGGRQTEPLVACVRVKTSMKCCASSQYPSSKASEPQKLSGGAILALMGIIIKFSSVKTADMFSS